jgi:hypothetical protein
MHYCLREESNYAVIWVHPCSRLALVPNKKRLFLPKHLHIMTQKRGRIRHTSPRRMRPQGAILTTILRVHRICALQTDWVTSTGGVDSKNAGSGCAGKRVC